jgi:hypothetical protein
MSGVIRLTNPRRAFQLALSKSARFCAHRDGCAFFESGSGWLMAQVDRRVKAYPHHFGPYLGVVPEWRELSRLRLVPLARVGLLCVLLAVAVCQASEETLITHPSVGLDNLTQNEARLYMTMRLNQWPNGRRTQVFVLPDSHPLHQGIAKGVLGLYPYQLRRAWDRQLFSGTGPAPITVATEAELIERVGSTPGALGYANSRALVTSQKLRALRAPLRRAHG